MDILKKLFSEWDLETWANVLEVVGFAFAMGAFFLGLFIKSEINKLKTSYIFDKRIKKHIENLKKSASEFNQFLNDYDNNRHTIRTEFGNCLSELQDLIPKIGFRQGWKSRNLICFLKARRTKPFVIREIQTSPFFFWLLRYPKRVYQTNYDDVWIVYDRLIEIIRQLENIKQNKDKSL
ncbi:MAG: hypothetical protein IPO85_12015 [Saprospiraceae bacterium]|uniref:DUF4760 domain-containing protein n=1 Tax=Candidatus Defluviibacterium haderslevense TaxID=2981993 RepID=A0A9D7S926_9BACT|nr:hypothetical protein [Candidatus Defluviibacterium haderslevense]